MDVKFREMRGVEVKREERRAAQIKEHKIWSGMCNKASLSSALLSSLFSPSIPAARLTSNGHRCSSPTSRFSRRALELRRVFRLTVYLLRVRVPQVIPVGRPGKTTAGKKNSPRSEFPDTFSSIYGVTVPPQNLFNYRAWPTWHTYTRRFIRVYVNFHAPRVGPRYRYQSRDIESISEFLTPWRDREFNQTRSSPKFCKDIFNCILTVIFFYDLLDSVAFCT